MPSLDHDALVANSSYTPSPAELVADSLYSRIVRNRQVSDPLYPLSRTQTELLLSFLPDIADKTSYAAQARRRFGKTELLVETAGAVVQEINCRVCVYVVASRVEEAWYERLSRKFLSAVVEQITVEWMGDNWRDCISLQPPVEGVILLDEVSCFFPELRAEVERHNPAAAIVSLYTPEQWRN